MNTFLLYFGLTLPFPPIILVEAPPPAPTISTAREEYFARKAELKERVSYRKMRYGRRTSYRSYGLRGLRNFQNNSRLPGTQKSWRRY